MANYCIFKLYKANWSMHGIRSFFALAFFLSVFMFGCVAKEGIPAENITTGLPPVTGAKLEFSAPVELPTAFVGKPFIFSFCDPQPAGETKYGETLLCGEGATTKNPTGGTPPYKFSANLYRHDVYAGVEHVHTSNWPNLQLGPTGLLNFTPQPGDEGEYELEVCALDWYQEDTACRNMTLHIMSDIVTVKGAGEAASSLLWRPDMAAIVRGSEGTGNITIIDIPELIPTSNLSSVNLRASIPEKYPRGGASTEINMTANPTTVSVSASGYAACSGKYMKYSEFVGEFVLTEADMDGFEVPSDSTISIGLNITNNGTDEKVVDIIMVGRSGVSADSANYIDARTAIEASLDYAQLIGRKTDVNATRLDILTKVRGLSPGETIVNRTVVRTIVEPGSHIIEVGRIETYLLSKQYGVFGIGCPSNATTSGELTITAVPADLSDGKPPIRRIYLSRDRVNSYVIEVPELEVLPGEYYSRS